MSRVALTIPIIVPYINFMHHTAQVLTPLVWSALSFDEANFSSSLDQGKHLASSLDKVSLYNIYIMP
jgi:hypothetical protein